MLLTLYLSAALIFLVFFALLPKKLTLLEILFCWMVIIYLHGMVLAQLLLNNPTLLQMNPDLYLVWTFVFSRFVFLPLLMIWLIDLYSWVRSLSIKTLLTAIFTASLVGIEYLSDWLKLTQHGDNWKIQWSFIMWASLILSVSILNAWFRNILAKEVNTE
jgi:hypothetical protein